jgi:fucose 4-O-acetylase-like acetyltransferase
VLDLIRASALAVVVLGHSAMGVIGWTDSGPVISTALSAYHPWASWATWLLQIMPLFFVAGGAANARSWRGTSLRYAPWLWRRVERLLRPVWVYLLVMAPLSGILSVLLPDAWATPLLRLATQLLWFIGVYVVVCALTPVLVRTFDARPALGPIVLVAAIAAVDWLRIGVGVAPVGLVNFVLVWALAAYLGLLLDAGRLHGWQGAGLALAAVATNLLLVGLGPYPLSMVGGSPGERFSNMAPPSLVLALHAVALAGLVGAARPALARLARVPTAWRATTAVNLTAMTLYLWHLPVLIAMVAVTHVLGLDRAVTWTAGGEPAPGPGYWLWTLLFLAVFLTLVAGVVRLMWPAEVGPLPGWDRAARTSPTRTDPGRELTRATAAASGTALVGVGTLMISSTGLAGFPTRVTTFAGMPLNPLAAILLTVAGGFLVRWAGAVGRSRRGPSPEHPQFSTSGKAGLP